MKIQNKKIIKSRKNIFSYLIELNPPNIVNLIFSLHQILS